MKLEPPVPFTDGRVALREMRREDVPAYVRAFTDDPELTFRIGSDHPPDEAEVLDYIAERPGQLEEGSLASFAVEEAGGLEFCGSIVLVRLDWRHLRGEVGLWLAPAARGRGVAAAAMRLVCRWAFDDLGLERLELKTETINEPMIGLAERLGFQREGVLRSYDRVQDKRSDLVLMSLLPGELSAG